MYMTQGCGLNFAERDSQDNTMGMDWHSIFIYRLKYDRIICVHTLLHNCYYIEPIWSSDIIQRLFIIFSSSHYKRGCDLWM